MSPVHKTAFVNWQNILNSLSTVCYNANQKIHTNYDLSSQTQINFNRSINGILIEQYDDGVSRRDDV